MEKLVRYKILETVIKDSFELNNTSIPEIDLKTLARSLMEAGTSFAAYKNKDNRLSLTETYNLSVTTNELLLEEESTSDWTEFVPSPFIEEMVKIITDDNVNMESVCVILDIPLERLTNQSLSKSYKGYNRLLEQVYASLEILRPFMESVHLDTTTFKTNLLNETVQEQSMLVLKEFLTDD